MKDVLIYWRKRYDGLLLVAGLGTMVMAGWSVYEPGFHKTGEAVLDFAQSSIPARHISQPAIVKIGEAKEVTMIGCWPRIQGDNDMSTSPGDYSPVRCSSNIYIDGQKVMLKVFYRVEEHGGDRTIYSGARTAVLFENTEPDYTIRTVELRGPRLNNFLLYSEGRNVDFKSFDTSDSYWEQLQYRVDSEGDDDTAVGVRGRIVFSVILENTRSVKLAAIL